MCHSGRYAAALSMTPKIDDTLAHSQVISDMSCLSGYYVPEDKKDLVNEDLIKKTKGRGLDKDETSGANREHTHTGNAT